MPFIEMKDYVQVDPDVFKKVQFDKQVGNSHDGVLQLHRQGRSRYVLDVTSPMTHAARLTLNKGFYQPHFMNAGKDTFLQPYKKPILTEHGMTKDNEAIGRAHAVQYVDTPHALVPTPGSMMTEIETFDAMRKLMESGVLYDKAFNGLGHLRVTARVTDQTAIEKFMDGRYATFSIRVHSDSALCPHCVKPFDSVFAYLFGEYADMDEEEIEKSKFCVHGPYAEVDGYPGFVMLRTMEFPESSVVSVPADVLASVDEMEMVYVNDSVSPQSLGMSRNAQVYALEKAKTFQPGMVDYAGRSLIRPGLVMVRDDGKRRCLLAQANKSAIEQFDSGIMPLPVVGAGRANDSYLQPALYLNSIPTVACDVSIEKTDNNALLRNQSMNKKKKEANTAAAATESTTANDTVQSQDSQATASANSASEVTGSTDTKGKSGIDWPVITDKTSPAVILEWYDKALDEDNRHRASIGAPAISKDGLTTLKDCAALPGSVFCGPNRSWPINSKADAIAAHCLLKHVEFSDTAQEFEKFFNRLDHAITRKGDQFDAWKPRTSSLIDEFSDLAYQMGDYDLADSVWPLITILRERKIDPSSIEDCAEWLSDFGYQTDSDTAARFGNAERSNLTSQIDALMERETQILAGRRDAEINLAATLRVLQDGLQAEAFDAEKEKLQQLTLEDISKEVVERMSRDSWQSSLQSYSDGFGSRAEDDAGNDAEEDKGQAPLAQAKTQSTDAVKNIDSALDTPAFRLVKRRFDRLSNQEDATVAENYLGEMYALGRITKAQRDAILEPNQTSSDSTEDAGENTEQQST